MARHYDPDDVPSIGDRRNNAIFVCQGDDRPTQWASWLADFVGNFEHFKGLADTARVTPKWEGSFISVYYYLGWLPVGQLRKAKTTARALLRAIERQTLATVRVERLAELEEIDDLDEFLEQTADDRRSLFCNVQRQSSELSNLKRANELLTKELALGAKQAKVADSTTLNRAILQFALDVRGGRPAPFDAGPLAFWTDGVVYVITKIGRENLPPELSPAFLLEQLRHLGQPVSALHESTPVAYYLNPFFRQGGKYASEWTTAWRNAPEFKRRFYTEDCKLSPIASQIAQEVASWAQ